MVSKIFCLPILLQILMNQLKEINGSLQQQQKVNELLIKEEKVYISSILKDLKCIFLFIFKYLNQDNLKFNNI